MSHHKRRRPKHQRAGCLICKPHKDERGKNGTNAQPIPLRRREDDDHKQLRDTEHKDKQ